MSTLQALEQESRRLSAEMLAAINARDFGRHRRLLDTYTATARELTRAREAAETALRRDRDRLSLSYRDCEIACYRAAVALWESRAARGVSGGPRPTMSASLRDEMFARASEGLGLADHLRRHFLAVCQHHNITPHFVVQGHRSGYALIARRIVEIAPIESAWDYSIALHEAGHIVCPCAPGHVRRKNDVGSTLCVACEVAAWRWAARTAIEWNSMAHSCLTSALGSYRGFATPAEQAEVDELCSPRSRTIRLDRLAASLATTITEDKSK